jgi:neutral ceramidase
MNNNRGSLNVGAARIDITPNDLTGLTNLWRTPFDGVHDPIYVRALIVDNGINCATVIAADLVEFGDTSELRNQIQQQFGIPASNILITASHDHNAPRVGSVTPGATAQVGGPATERYTNFVYKRILEAVRQAKAALRPARVGVGRGTADVNTNRDIYTPEGWTMGANPDRHSDKTVWVVKFESASSEPIAILMNYAVHSVVLGPYNTLVTGDLAGAAERYIENHYGDKVVALWTLGAAGDQNPKYMNHHESPPQCSEKGYQMMTTFGQILGEEVIRVADQIKRKSSNVRIEAQEKVVSCPARIPPRDAQRKGMEVKKVDSLDIHLGLLLIDHIALTWVSGEVVTDIYRHLKKESPFSNTIMITITNDRVGYIIHDAGYDTPTFASTAFPLERGHAEPAIVNGLIEMISKY